MAAVPQRGVGRPVAPPESAQGRGDADPLVQEVDGRLHLSVVAQSPFMADLSPVFRPIRAACQVAELALVLCAALISSCCSATKKEREGEREREPTDFLSSGEMAAGEEEEEEEESREGRSLSLPHR